MKKIKIITFIVLFELITINFIAQSINLPSQDIIGTLTEEPDSLFINKDLSDRYKVENPEKLQYKPIHDKITSNNFYKQPNGFLHFDANSSDYFDVKFGYANKKIPIFNAYGKYNVNKFGKDKDNNYHTKKRLNLEYEPLSGITKYNLNVFGYLNTGRYESKFVVKESKFDSIETGISSTPDNLKAFISSFRSSISFVNNNFNDRNNKYLDFELNSNFNDLADVNVYWRYNSLHFAANYFFVQNIGVHLQYSNFIFPSVYAIKSFEINEDSQISIANIPFLKTDSLINIQDDFAFAEIEKNTNYSQQIPINIYINYNLLTEIETNVFLNSRYINNYRYVKIVSDSLASWNFNDAQFHVIGADLRKNINNWSIKVLPTFKYYTNINLKNHDLPWEHRLKIDLSALYAFSEKLSIEGVMNSNFLPIDSKLIKKMKNKNIISCILDYEIKENINFSAYINNIFNDENEIVNGLAEDGLNAGIKFRVRF